MTEKILVFEDERIIAYDIKKCLEKSGYIVPGIIAYGEQAIQKVAEFNPDLVLMDVMLKGEINGIEAAEEIINSFQIPVVYLTGLSDNNTLLKAKYTQPFGYVLKPFDTNQLITTIEIALNKFKTEVFMRSELEKQKEINSLKTRFVSMVSHEFRNPLSTIFTSAELLANHGDKLTEGKKIEYLHFIQNSAKNLNNLLNDILSIGKSEVEAQFNAKPIDLQAFCQSLVAEISICTGDKHKIIFTNKETNIASESQLLNAKKSLPCLDEKLLRHILTNLLVNAIKYSPNGGCIQFELFCLEGEAIFRIQDEGIGIPKLDQETLFNSFHRGSNVGTIPGSGLGLSIVKHYIDLHGGEITFASKEGVGTTFIVSLPFKS